jgi:septal ring factor EnvC (AmiA/AmiB activator)
MSKRWWITVIVIVVVLIIIGILYDNGMLNFKWQGLTMIFAGLAAPYTLIKNWLFRNKDAQDILGKHQQIRAEEKIHREQTDEEISKKEQRIKDLDKDIELSEKKIQLLEEKKKNVTKDVKKMSIEDTQNEAINYFGS